jgi:hypothetical protein
MAKRRSKKVLTDDDWISKRASSFRSSSLARAKLLGKPTSSIPMPIEIKIWLRERFPLRCYLSDTIIPRDSAELDHKDPVVRGGSFSFENIGITTRYYNNAKGRMNEEEFRSLLNLIQSWEDKGKDLLLRLIASNNRFRRRK